MDGMGAGGLDRTSSRVFGEANVLLQSAIDKASAARTAGSSRSRGYASLIVLVVGILFQSGGIFALGKLSPPTSRTNRAEPVSEFFNISEVGLINSNLSRIKSNVSAIAETKNKIAPSMQIDSNTAAIEASVQDLQTLLSTKISPEVASK